MIRLTSGFVTANMTTAHCKACSARFSLFQWGYICQHCDGSFCSRCCQSRLVADPKGTDKSLHRMCNPCVAQHVPLAQVQRQVRELAYLEQQYASLQAFTAQLQCALNRKREALEAIMEAQGGQDRVASPEPDAAHRGRSPECTATGPLANGTKPDLVSPRGPSAPPLQLTQVWHMSASPGGAFYTPTAGDRDCSPFITPTGTPRSSTSPPPMRQRHDSWLKEREALQLLVSQHVATIASREAALREKDAALAEGQRTVEALQGEVSRLEAANAAAVHWQQELEALKKNNAENTSSAHWKETLKVRQLEEEITSLKTKNGDLQQLVEALGAAPPKVWCEAPGCHETVGDDLDLTLQIFPSSGTSTGEVQHLKLTNEVI